MTKYLTQFITARALIAGFVGAGLSLASHFHPIDVDSAQTNAMGFVDAIYALVSWLVTAGIVSAAHKAPTPDDAAKGMRGPAAGGLVMVVCLGMSGCAKGGFLQQLADGGLSGIVQQYGPDAVAGAQMLCADKVSRARKISLQDAMDGVCNTLEVVEPFIPIFLDARDKSRSDRSLRVPE